MKRTVALICSAVLALSVAPFASATVGESTVAPSATANVAAESQLSIPTTSTKSRDSKKACRKFCVSTTMPEAQIDTFFVNDNRHVLSVNYDSVSLYNLDTRRVTDTESVPTGVQLSKAVASEGVDEVYVVGYNGSSEYFIYRINLETLEFTDVTPESPTYAPTYYEYAVLPDNSGYIATVAGNGSLFLCSYSELGVEVGCTSSLSGAGQTTSKLFFHYTGFLVHMVGAENKIFTIDLRDMSFTWETLTGFDIEIGESSFADSYIWVAERVGMEYVPTTKLVKISTVSNTVVGTYDIPGKLVVSDIIATQWEVFMLGQPVNAAGRFQKYATLTYVLLDPTFEVKKTFQIPRPRGTMGTVDSLNIDNELRYVLAAGDSNQTSVVSIWGADVRNTVDYDQCLPGWIIRWDFLNLQAGKSVSAYDIYVKRDAPRAKWGRVDSVARGGEHVYELTRAEEGDFVKVVPRKAKFANADTDILEVGPPPIVIEGTRQPRC